MITTSNYEKLKFAHALVNNPQDVQRNFYNGNIAVNTTKSYGSINLEYRPTDADGKIYDFAKCLSGTCMCIGKWDKSDDQSTIIISRIKETLMFVGRTIKDDVRLAFYNFFDDLCSGFNYNPYGYIKSVRVGISMYNDIRVTISLTEECKNDAVAFNKLTRQEHVNALSDTIYGERLRNMNSNIRQLLEKNNLHVSTIGGRSGGGWWASAKTHNEVYLYVQGEDDYLSGHKFRGMRKDVEGFFGGHVKAEFDVFCAPNGISFSTDLDKVAYDMLNGIN